MLRQAGLHPLGRGQKHLQMFRRQKRKIYIPFGIFAVSGINAFGNLGGNGHIFSYKSKYVLICFKAFNRSCGSAAVHKTARLISSFAVWERPFFCAQASIPAHKNMPVLSSSPAWRNERAADKTKNSCADISPFSKAR